MNFYPFHIGDYASSTRHLSWDEDLAYRRLIDAYYTHEKPIPVDERLAFRLVCASTEDQREAVSAVLNEFFVLTETGWVHYRCEEEISKCVDKKTKASQSAKARWSNATNTNSALPTQSERNTDASEEVCERIQNGCEGNAPNPNPNPNPITNKEQNLCAAQAAACAQPEEKPAKRKSRMPEGFTPNDAGVEKAKADGLDVQVEVEKFRDHHTAAGSSFSDWQAAWRTWIRKAVEIRASRGNQQGKIHHADGVVQIESKPDNGGTTTKLVFAKGEKYTHHFNGKHFWVRDGMNTSQPDWILGRDGMKWSEADGWMIAA